MVPVMERVFFCRIAGNQASTPKEYTNSINITYKDFGLRANFFDKNSPTAKNKADSTNQIM